MASKSLSILFHGLKVPFNTFLAFIITPSLASFSKSLLLSLAPVLVEATSALLTQMLGPDSLEGAKTTWCLDVTNNTNDHEGWGFYNGDSFHNLLLVHL